jgi:predicted transcriptional regulator of viral defense system
MKRGTKIEKLLDFVREKGVIRASELDKLNMPSVYLTRLVREGRLERVSRGLYRLPEGEVTEYFTHQQVAKKIPHGVICLISALRFHDLTTQIPHQVWIAIERGKWEISSNDLPIRICEFSGPSFYEGIESHLIGKTTVRIYNVAKTVADCFKYRNKVGHEVAIEALRDALRKRECSIDDIWHYAKICRVASVIRPYLEATI